MNCFTAPPIITGREEEEIGDDDDEDDDYSYNNRNKNEKKESDLEIRRGAILADDMGLIQLHFYYLIVLLHSLKLLD